MDDIRPDIDDDEFGRTAFVQRAIALLDDISTDPASVVLGLVGPWGSGKSSTLRWITDGLDDDRWRVTTTGAWAAAGPDGVVLELLRVLNDVLDTGPELERRRQVRRIARAASSTVTAIAPAVEQVPVVGPALSKIGWGSLLPSATDPPLHQQLEDLKEVAAQASRSTLVVVDDVDRLQPDELLALFRAVRVLGRLPRVHYLLVYDEETLLRLLGQTAVARGEAGGAHHAADFLEKVVILPLAQPPAARDDVERLLVGRLQEAVHDAGGEVTPQVQQRLETEVGLFFSELIATPRAVVRFAAQLHSYLPLVRPDAIDVIDFAVLTLLRLRHPRLYDAVARDSWALVTRKGDAGAEIRRRWESVTITADHGVPVQERETVFQALQRLFPHGVGVAETGIRAAARMLHEDAPRVGDADFTDLYFSLVPPGSGGDDGLADRAVEELVAGAPGVAWDLMADTVAAGGTERVADTPRRSAESTASRRATRLLRRASQLHRSVDSAPGAREVGALLSLCTRLGSEHSATGPRAAVSAWLAGALSEPAAAHVAEVLQAIGAPDASEGAGRRLLVLVDVMTGRELVRDDTEELRDQLAQAAWLLAAAATHEDDPTPFALLRAVDRLVPHRLDVLLPAWLSSAPEGTPLINLVAQWWAEAPVGEDLAGDAAWLPAIVRIVGPQQVVAELSQPPSSTTPTEADASHEVARASLRRVLCDTNALSLRLPRGLDPAAQGPRRNLPRPLQSVVDSGLGSPDLGFLLSAHVATPEMSEEPPRDPTAWDRVISSLADGSATSAWLARVAPSWDGKHSGWRRIVHEPGVVTAVTAAVHTRRAGGARVQVPVRVAAQVSRTPPGGATSPPGLGIVVEMAMWMEELDGERLPTQGRQQGVPLPAALTVVEAKDAVGAIVQGLLGAVEVARPLLSWVELQNVVQLDFESTGKRPWEVVHLPNEVVMSEGVAARQVEQHLMLRPTAVASVVSHSDRVTEQLLHQWLRRAGAEDSENLPW